MELTFSIFFEIFYVYGLVVTGLSDLAHTIYALLYSFFRSKSKAGLLCEGHC
jgi:hypothetical protein